MTGCCALSKRALKVWEGLPSVEGLTSGLILPGVHQVVNRVSRVNMKRLLVVAGAVVGCRAILCAPAPGNEVM